MSEFIGSRISLISKSDIKYVGTLHEINSENSTVALENVKSYGTEGRRGNPDEEIPPNDQIYDYIVFRGSDVKDLTIVEAPKENQPPPPPQVPNDPAILGAARPNQQGPPPPQQQQQQQQQQHQQQPPPNQQWGGPQQPPQFPPYGYPPPPHQQSRFQPPGGLHGFPGAPGAVPGFGPPPGYGPPPGWYPPGQGPPAQGFPQGPPGPFSPHNMPIGPPGQQNQGPQQAPIGSRNQTPSQAPQQPPPPPADSKPSELSGTPAASAAQPGPPPPVESKPDVAAATAPPEQRRQAPGPRNPRVAVPNIPLQAKPGNAPASTLEGAQQQQQSATQAAAAAVAAAMAKLGPPGQAPPQSGVPQNAMDNLTRKVGEMRTGEQIRHSRQPGTGGYAAGHRGGRGGRRPSAPHAPRGVDVPQTDFDFESSNAKFNKQDLVKEAIATGSPLGTPAGEDEGKPFESATNGASHEPDVVIPKAAGEKGYNKSSSFFDNISSELKDRQAAQDEGKRLGGMEFRTEERKKNMDTFGQSNVDTGYRGGFRGRGRGRGFVPRGRGYMGGRGGGFRGRGQSGAPAEV